MRSHLSRLFTQLNRPNSSYQALGAAAHPHHRLPHGSHNQHHRHHHHDAKNKMSKTDHADRTAHEPRDPSLHRVVLARVDEVNPTIRIFRLETASGIRFLPGQWLDVFVPGIDRPGGFTITSTPSKARASTVSATAAAPTTTTTTTAPPSPYLELAVQKSPQNVVAQWLWQPIDAILSSELYVRVGGSFVWPPPGVMPTTLRKLVFVAGGVGINPLISIASHLAESPGPHRYTVDFLYSLRDPGDGARVPAQMLFLERLAGLFGGGGGGLGGELKLFLTPGAHGAGVEGRADDGRIDGLNLAFKRRRITIQDVDESIGAEKRSTVVYVCGVPKMTDKFVEQLTSPKGLALEPFKVLYEKWW